MTTAYHVTHAATTDGEPSEGWYWFDEQDNRPRGPFPSKSRADEAAANHHRIEHYAMNDLDPLAEGDILCITAGPYPDNLGKLLRYRSGDELITAVVMDRAITFCDGFSRHMECGEGELVLISSDHVTVVA